MRCSIFCYTILHLYFFQKSIFTKVKCNKHKCAVAVSELTTNFQHTSTPGKKD